MEAQVEHFVSSVGGCGPFQVMVAAAVSASVIVSGWSMFMMVFGSYDPGWICMNHTDKENVSLLGQNAWAFAETAYKSRNGSADVDVFPPSSTTEDRCELAKTCSHIVFNPDSSTIVTEWTLICDRAWIASIIISIQMVGVVVGTVVSGYLGDKFGRKNILYSWIGVSAVMNAVAVFSVSWQMFAIVRFTIGLSMGGILSFGYVYHQEFVTSKWRVYLTVFPIWSTGLLVFSVIVWLLADWRYVHIVIAVLAGLILPTAFWVPESMRWLAVHGRTEDAKKVAKQICKFNRRPCPPEHLINFAKSEGSTKEKNTSISLLFKRQVIKITILSTCLMFFHSCMYYAVGFGINSLFGDFYINMVCFASFSIPLALVSPYLTNRFGRRWMSLIFVGTAAILSFAAVLAFFTMSSDEKGIFLTVVAIAGSVCVDTSWGILNTFFAELFPTSIRSMGFSCVYFGARVGGIVAPFCIPQSPDLLYVPYLGMGVLAVACCAMVMSLPETNGQGLNDTIAKDEDLSKTDNMLPLV